MPAGGSDVAIDACFTTTLGFAVYSVITIAIRLRHDYDLSCTSASIRRDSTQAKMNMSIFRRSRIV